MKIDKKSWWYGAGGTATFLFIIGVITMLPDIQRYIKIRSM
jgi:hypothetical protein